MNVHLKFAKLKKGDGAVQAEGDGAVQTEGDRSKEQKERKQLKVSLY